MQKLQLEVPAMYGDHHVLAVRNIVLGMNGVEEVLASAAWRTIEVMYDPEKISPEQIERRLAEEGYTQPAQVPVLDPETVRSRRYSSSLVEATRTFSFLESLPTISDYRPLWPCPGMTPWRAETEQAQEHADG